MCVELLDKSVPSLMYAWLIKLRVQKNSRKIDADLIAFIPDVVANSTFLKIQVSFKTIFTLSNCILVKYRPEITKNL